MTFAAPAHAAKHQPKPMTQNFGRWKLLRMAAAFLGSTRLCTELILQ